MCHSQNVWNGNLENSNNHEFVREVHESAIHILIWIIEMHIIGTFIFLSNFKNRWALSSAISGLYFQVVFIMHDFFLLFQFISNISVLGTIFIFIMCHALKFFSRYGSLYSYFILWSLMWLLSSTIYPEYLISVAF